MPQAPRPSIPAHGMFSFWKLLLSFMFWAPLVAQMVKNLPVMQDTWVRSLGQADALEKGTATCPSVPAWRIPWTEEPGRLQSMGSQRIELN